MSDVKSFGAAGDGVQDDTRAIVHAIEQGDGYLVFSKGKYKVSKTIEIDLSTQGPISIDGSGATATIEMHGEGPAFRFTGSHEKTAHPESVNEHIFASERMPTIQNLAFTARNKNGDGIELVKTFQPTLTQLHFRHCRNAIRFHQRNRNPIVSNCHIYHNEGVGILIDDCNLHQINIIGNHISYNRLGGIRIENSQVYNLQITGNDIEYNNHNSHDASPMPVAEIFIDSTGPTAIINEVTIASNTIQSTVSPGGCNLRIAEDRSNKSMRLPGLYAITGNVIGSQETNMHLSGCHGITISGNTIYSSEKLNVLIEDSDQIIFNANVMRRHADHFNCGVGIKKCKNSVISNCIIEDEHPDGQPTNASTWKLKIANRF